MTGDPKTTLWEFFVHIVVAIALFLLISLPAVALDFLVKWLIAQKVSSPIIIGLKAMEYTILTADAVLLLVFLVKSTYRAARKL